MYLCLFNPEHRWEQGCVVLAQTSPCHHWVWAGGIFSGLHCVCHSLWAVKRDFFPLGDPGELAGVIIPPGEFMKSFLPVCGES